MARWVPDDRDGLDAMIQGVVDMFGIAEERLLRALALQGRAGLALGKGPQDALNLGALRLDAIRIAKSLADAYPDEVARVMNVAAKDGANAALKEMSALAEVQDLTSTTRMAGSPAAQAMTADLTSALDDVTKRILRFPDDVYRQAVGRSAVNVTLGQATGKQAQQTAWNTLLDQRVTGFTDRAGRDWNLSSYTEMATRTATRRAWDDSRSDTMRENGVDLVSIIVGSGACKQCSDWAGKILRLDSGPTGRIEIPSAVGDDSVTVNVTGTIDDAERSGWRHPNCRCSTVAYLPGLSVVADITTYDPDAEKARSRLRSLERQVRASKLKAASSLTADDLKVAGGRTRELQARLREHVATTGVTRQRNREQINLDNRRA